MTNPRPDSPCVGLCTVLYDDNCAGCGRHFKEVANWVFLTEKEKGDIWDRVAARGFPVKREIKGL